MKNNKGITLVALIITIIVILIIVGITATSATNLIQKSKMTDYIAYMKLVKARADDVYEEKIFQGKDLKSDNSITEDLKNKFFAGKAEDYSSYTFLKWKKTDIADQGIDNSILKGDENKYYFVIVFDKSTCETVDVAYSAGCALGSTRYYTLTDMEKVVSGNQD